MSAVALVTQVVVVFFVVPPCLLRSGANSRIFEQEVARAAAKKSKALSLWGSRRVEVPGHARRLTQEKAGAWGFAQGALGTFEHHVFHLRIILRLGCLEHR